MSPARLKPCPFTKPINRSSQAASLWSSVVVCLPAILPDMEFNPAAEWQRLTELYAAKSDEELMELGEDFADLTDTAKQTLRDEMKRRGLADPGAEKKKPAARVRSEKDLPAAIHWERQGYVYSAADGETGGEHEKDFTWKTPLCECDTKEQAWQLGEVLRRAGIDSWIQEPGRSAWEDRSLRVSVAADQLEAAQAIGEQPIPQDVIEESKRLNEAPEYESPKCPACGAEDPVLMNGAKLEYPEETEEEIEAEAERAMNAVPETAELEDGVNRWRCEECGNEWTDSAEASSAGLKN